MTGEQTTGERKATGTAGVSARREYERRRTKREERIRAAHPRLGGLVLALSDDPQSTRAWRTGAEGEERLGGRLDALRSESLAVLHDRRIPRTRRNIDHVVVTTAGVWVVDAKRYQGRPRLVVDGGILRPRVERLVVGRRDCTKVVEGVLSLVALVREVVDDVPVTGALCFVDADWPLVGGDFTVGGVETLWPRKLGQRLALARGGVAVESVADRLAAHLPPA